MRSRKCACTCARSRECVRVLMRVCAFALAPAHVRACVYIVDSSERFLCNYKQTLGIIEMVCDT